MEKTNLKQPFFLKPYFFGFWTKSTRTFHKNFLADFEKTNLRVQRNSLWKSLRQKKELINKTISRNLFWQLSDFCWNFSGCFVKTVFYLRVTFWWKAAFASEILIGKFFFGHWTQTLKVLAILLPAQFYKLLSTCLKGKHLWVPIIEQKQWFLKFLQTFMIWRIHSKTSSVFFNELLAVLSKLHSRCPDDQFVKKSNLGKKLWKW